MKQIELVTGLLVVFLLVTPASTQSMEIILQSMPGALEVSLTIDFGNGTVANYTGLSAPNVYNLTTMLFDVDARWAGDRVYIDAIDGVFRDEIHGWQYWVNGNYSTIAANQYILKDGDFVLWNRTVSGFQNDPAQPDQTTLVGGLLIAGGGLVFLALLYRRSIRR
ncbi:MAG: DUF4430 domain-containing protein [Candidatus Thorarchaeota archaeon]